MKTYLTEYTTETVPEGSFGRRFAGPDVKAKSANEAFLLQAEHLYHENWTPAGIVSMEIVGHYHPGDD